MLFGSIERLLSPGPIRYQEAIVVAVVGLAVNLVCALILGRVQHGGDGDHHGHGHGDGHSHGHGRGHAHAHHDHAHAGHAHADHAHADLNLRSAYMHVIADAATSVLAIAALVGGWIFGWAWLDPVMGIVGAVLVALWAKGLIADTGRILLDREMDHPVVDEIREVIAEHGASPRTEIADLHVWRVGRAAYACALSLVTDDPGLTPQRVRTWLAVHDEVVHTTIEIHQRTSAEA
jgi:cation diffusion facilitator family transporter